MTIQWIPVHLAIRWHSRLVDLCGGAPGLRDEGLLESALARPKNLFLYEDGKTSLERLATIYAIGVTKAHACVDGNKRLGFAVMAAFLKAHGLNLDATEREAARIIVGVAASEIDEASLEDWIRSAAIPSAQ